MKHSKKKSVNNERKRQVDATPYRPQSSDTFRLALGCRLLRSIEAPCTKNGAEGPPAELPSKEPTAAECARSKLLGISPRIAYGTVEPSACCGELFEVAK